MVDGMEALSQLIMRALKAFALQHSTILRKSANLILNLVALMVDANIPDIKPRERP